MATVTRTSLKSVSSLRGSGLVERSLERSVTAEQYQFLVAFTLLVLLCLSFLLRTLFLGSIFQSSDNAELPWKILKNTGYTWIIREYYGALINVYVKLFVGFISSIGVSVTEFWWKVPIAIIGTLQTPLTFYFLRHRACCSETGALARAAFIAILPIHVFLSRYSYGVEVLAAFFVTLATWKLLDFFDKPSLKTGLGASAFARLYLISHGYILPFMACLTWIVLLFAPSGKPDLLSRFTTGVKLCLTYYVWVFPLLVFPLCVYPIGHALRKPTRLGFYLQEHLPVFIENAGYLLALIFLVTIVSLCVKSARSKYTLLLVLCSTAYFAPLLFGTPRTGVTSVRPYMLMGTYFLVLAGAVFLDTWTKTRKQLAPVTVFVAVAFFVTLWGTVETLFIRDHCCPN